LSFRWGASGGPSKTSRPAAIRSTGPILELLTKLGLSPAQVAKVLAPFPVAGLATYDDDGRGIHAAPGTPVIATTAGVVSDVRSSSLRLTGRDRTQYGYAALGRVAPGIASGTSVVKGQVLGFTGRSPLDFSIRPRGGAAVSPVPYLDRWLAESLASARTLERAPDGTLRLTVAGRPVVVSDSPARAAAAGPSASRVERGGSTVLWAADAVASSVPSDRGAWAGALALVAAAGWLSRTVLRTRRRRGAIEPIGGLVELG
jgi:hypothetical protein